MSKKPVLLVGNGIRSANAKELLLELALRTEIPVVTTMNAVDLVQDDMKIGFIGVYGNRAANMILQESDLVISIGARLGIRQVGNKLENFAPKAKLIRNDIDQYELSRQIKSDEEKYLLDAKVFLEKLLLEEIPQYQKWNQKCYSVKELLKEYDKVVGNYLMETISTVLPPNPLVAVDVGQNQCWAAQSLNLKGQEGRILISGGYGSMGCGLPFAIGASIANNNCKTFCITGDGGLQMNIQELETVAREQLPVKILVANNFSLGKISEIQYGSYDGNYAQTTKNSGYSVPDFENVAKAYKIKSTKLNNYLDLLNYREWLEDNEPCLINIPLPEDTKLIPKIQWETGKINPIIGKIDSDKIQAILA